MGLFRFLHRLIAPLVGSPDVDPSGNPSNLNRRDLTPPTANHPPSARSTLESNAPGSTSDSSSSVGLEGLDASRFQPLSQDEALSETQQAGWTTAYLDSLQLIPPQDLPRIKVIDQTMVGMGLISAEELAEIHRVGSEMNQFRTDYRVIGEAGQQAVERSRQARQARKDALKQAAAERADQHHRQVAHRKATDIVFLGRGVSRGLADRRANVERLQSADLPVLSTPNEVAVSLGISIPTLRWLAFHHPASLTTHYHQWKIPKRSGGTRTISRPHKKLESAQRWILGNILQKRPLHPSAHGFVPGRSTLTGAKPHLQSAVIINCDLRDFFPTIDFARVAGLFQSMGYSPAVATILSLLCTECPRRVLRRGGQVLHVATGKRGLPQGACTSPMLSNLIARRLDQRLESITRKLHWRYTRYADDLTVSTSADASKVGYMLARIRHIAKDEGFEIKDSKTRVLRHSTKQCVTGIVVNDRPSIDRKTIRRLRSILHHAKHDGLESQNRESHPNFSGWLRGMIAYVEMVNPQQGQKLRRQFESLCS